MVIFHCYVSSPEGNPLKMKPTKHGLRPMSKHSGHSSRPAAIDLRWKAAMHWETQRLPASWLAGFNSSNVPNHAQPNKTKTSSMTGDGKHSTPQTWLSLGMMMMMMMMAIDGHWWPLMAGIGWLRKYVEVGGWPHPFRLQHSEGSLALRRPVLRDAGCQRPRSPRCTWCCVFAVVSLSLLWPSLGGKMSRKPEHRKRSKHWKNVIRLDWWEMVGTFTGSQGSYMFLPFSAFFMIDSPFGSWTTEKWVDFPKVLARKFNCEKMICRKCYARLHVSRTGLAGAWQLAGQPWVWVKRIDPKMTKCLCLLVNWFIWFNWMV